MYNPLKYLLVAITPIYMTGCSLLQQDPDIEYIKPLSEVALSVGESAIVDGAIGLCGRKPRSWSEISHTLPKPQTGFFSNGGFGFLESKRCAGATPVLAVKFTATKPGTENISVFGRPVTIVINNDVNFLHSNEIFVPNKTNKKSFFGIDLSI